MNKYEFIMTEEIRKVGKRGQVTIPKAIREREGIKSEDRVKIMNKDHQIVIEKIRKKKEMKEGYQRMRERIRKINKQWSEVSKEANSYL